MWKYRGRDMVKAYSKVPENYWNQAMWQIPWNEAWKIPSKAGREVETQVVIDAPGIWRRQDYGIPIRETYRLREDWKDKSCIAPEGRYGGMSLSKVVRAGKVHHKDKMLDSELKNLVFPLVFHFTICQPFLDILLFYLGMEEFILYHSVWEIFHANFDIARDHIREITLNHRRFEDFEPC